METSTPTPTPTSLFNSGPPSEIACIISNGGISSHRRSRKSHRFAKSRRVPKSQNEGRKLHESRKSRRYASTGVTNAIIFPQFASPPSPLVVESEVTVLVSGTPLSSPTWFPQDYGSPSSSHSSSTPSDFNGTTGTEPNGGSTSVGLVVAVVVVLAVVIVGAIGFCAWWRRKKSSQQAPSSMVGGDTAGQWEACSTPHVLDDKSSSNQREVNLADVQLPSSRFGPRSFSYQQLSIATKNFSSSELLGRGGFGPVYRGTLPDGSLIAVKCISDDSSQGMKEFKAEVTIISDLRHRNLVKLRGWCDEDKKFFLVYEFLSQGSLDNLLFNNERCVELSWSRRFSIMLGLGSALRYLHEECDSVIIHRDVKSSNVLLDENFVAKLGDFGLSRQVDQGESSLVTLVAGTRGYMAPEIFGTGKATRESDVYSYGAVLAEVACGRRPVDASLAELYHSVLVDWVWDLHSKGRLLDAADERLNGLFDAEQMRRVLIVALACSHPDPRFRPTIRHITEALNGNMPLPSISPSKPTPNYAHMPPLNIQQVLRDSCTTSSSAATTSSTPFSISSDQLIR